MNVIITSAICTVKDPLSYSFIRSVYTHNERFYQTLNTINSIRLRIPNAYIILLEVTPVDEFMEYILLNVVDVYVNYNSKLQYITNSPYKSAAEALTILTFLNEHITIDDNTFFKISGRYY